MALTEWYVRPDDNDTAGDGSSGDPYGDLQALLDNEVMSTSGGTRINISDFNGTAEILAANADWTTAFFLTTSPSVNNQLIISGYTSAAGDGGIGTIDGNALYSGGLLNAKNFITLRNLHFTNCGSITYMFRVGIYCLVDNCEFDVFTGNAALGTGNYALITNNYFHNMAATAVETTICGVVGNRFEDGTNKLTGGIAFAADGGFVIGNTFWFNNTATAYAVNHRINCYIANNSFVNQLACVNHAIQGDGTDKGCGIIENNLIRGWDGTAGEAIELASAAQTKIVRGNGFFENTAEITNPTQALFTENNETLTASPYTDDTTKDFRPVDTDNVKEGSLPGGIGLY